MTAYSIVLGVEITPDTIDAVNSERDADNQIGSEPGAWSIGELVAYLYGLPDDYAEVVSIEVTP